MTDGQTGRGDLTNKSLQKDCKWKGIVTVNSWLSVRKWAGIVYETCSFSPLLDGTVVEVCDSVLDKKGEVWYYINYKGKYGFVHSAYIRKKE